jgi:conserved oligomeric Golgi complex subunit 2
MPPPPPTQYPSDSDTDSDLPFPEPLLRSAFLAPTFSPSTFLATLSHRHQTLADLRSDLQSRSTAVAAELQTLVNDEYAAFLSLGAALRGADEKVEEVKVGVLGFEKSVKGVREVVAERKREVERLVKEREEIVRQMVLGREMLAVAERVEDLEKALAVGGDDHDWDDEESEPDIENNAQGEAGNDESEKIVMGTGRLQRLVHSFVSTQNQISRLGGSEPQPFLSKLEEQMHSIRETLLLDLSTALKQARGNQTNGGRLVKIMNLYGLLDESAAAIKVLKDTR